MPSVAHDRTSFGCARRCACSPATACSTSPAAARSRAAGATASPVPERSGVPPPRSTAETNNRTTASVTAVRAYPSLLTNDLPACGGPDAARDRRAGEQQQQTDSGDPERRHRDAAGHSRAVGCTTAGERREARVLVRLLFRAGVRQRDVRESAGEPDVVLVHRVTEVVG